MRKRPEHPVVMIVGLALVGVVLVLVVFTDLPVVEPLRDFLRALSRL